MYQGLSLAAVDRLAAYLGNFLFGMALAICPGLALEEVRVSLRSRQDRRIHSIYTLPDSLPATTPTYHDSETCPSHST
jgi:hypothetical protein